MKKQLLILTFVELGASSFLAKAQTIPNADFENWTGAGPTGWLTGGSVSQSADKESGIYAAKLTPILPTGTNNLSILYLNDMNMLPTNIISKYLNGYVKTNISFTDTLNVIIIYTRNSDQAGAFGFDFTSVNRNSWTPFHVTIAIPPNYTPDSFQIGIYLTGSTSSYVLIDHLTLSDTLIGNELGTSLSTGIKNVSNAQHISSSVYPNPVNENAEIDFALSTSSNISMNVYDVTGRFVKTILNENRSAGDQKIKMNTEELQNGIYFYTITGNGFNGTGKFIVSK